MITKISELLNTEEKDLLPKKIVKTLDSFNEALNEIRKEKSIIKEVVKKRTRKNNNRISKKQFNNNKSRRR
jgi:hypothetical protein